MNESGSIIPVLESLGYKLRKHSNYYMSNAVYRGGDDINSLVYYPNNNYFIDFVTNEKGSGEKLISLTLNIPVSGVPYWLKKQGYDNIIFNHTNIDEAKIKMSKVFELDILKELLPVHNYWNNKGISTETLKLFKGGLATKGKLAGRYVLPIFNDKATNIIGFIGRDTYNNIEDRPKYKLIGDKSQFKWPLFLNKQNIINKQEVILVESSHCVLKMWESGINNVLCIFGTELSIPLLNEIIALDPKKIIIALNNEPNNNNIGNNASDKLYIKLCKYFDKKQINIFLPDRKDFGEQTIEENVLWYNKMKEKVYAHRKEI
jgi:hypothetical protein